MTVNSPAQTRPGSHQGGRAPQSSTFYKVACRAINDEPDTEGAARRISESYEGERATWDARLRGLQAEASQMSTELRRRVEMLNHAVNITGRELAAAGEMAATLHHQTKLIQRLHHVASQSIDGTVSAVDLMTMLTEEIPPPFYSPMVVGFVPDFRYRGGQFKSPNGDITVVYPFVGFSLLVKRPGAGAEIEPTFLVQDRALCGSTIEIERGLVLEGALLPMTGQ